LLQEPTTLFVFLQNNDFTASKKNLTPSFEESIIVAGQRSFFPITNSSIPTHPPCCARATTSPFQPDTFCCLFYPLRLYIIFLPSNQASQTKPTRRSQFVDPEGGAPILCTALIATDQTSSGATFLTVALDSNSASRRCLCGSILPSSPQPSIQLPVPGRVFP